jgi:hypothetical protein
VTLSFVQAMSTSKMGSGNKIYHCGHFTASPDPLSPAM